MTFDLIVAGAGLTGLTAAYRSAQAGKSVLVLEARNRVGGRTYTITETRGGVTSHFDLGAHFIGDEEFQAPVWDLVQELGLKTFKQYEGPEDTQPTPEKFWAGEGANLQVFGIDTPQPEIAAYIGTTVPPSDPGKAYIIYLEQLSQSVWLADPARTQNADRLDAMSVWDWVCMIDLPGYGAPVKPAGWTGDTWGNAPETFRALTRMLCRVGFSTEPENISMLWLLFYVKSSGGLARFQSLRWPIQGAQGYRLTEGAQSIATTLAERIGTMPNCAVMSGRTVTRVTDSAGTVTVGTAEAGDFEGRKALIAMAPALNGTITFDPPMPAARQKAVTSMANSHMIMTFVTFDTPFWRKDTSRYTSGTVNGLQVPDNISEFGLSGDALMADGDVVWVMDNTADEGTAALFAFIVGDAARKLSAEPASAREAVVLKTMGILFGEAEVSQNNPRYYELDWNKETFSKGCPAGHFLPGTFLACADGVLLSRLQTTQTGNVHFASTEAATISNGYMAGAVWSGEQVARDILTALGSAPVPAVDMQARKIGMQDCVNQIMRAIETQIPMLEWPALTEDCAFMGPGGVVLPTTPEGQPSYRGQQGTIEFYTRMGFFFTLTNVRVLRTAINPQDGFAFCSFTVDGVVNTTGQPFQGIYATMVFEFTDPSQGAPLIKADRLIMDSVLIDNLVMPPLPPERTEPPEQSDADRRDRLEKRAEALRLWLAGGADAAENAAYEYTVVYGAGGDLLPRGPFYGQTGVRTVFQPVVGQNTTLFDKVEIRAIALDDAMLSMMIVFDVAGKSPSTGTPFDTQLVVNMRIAQDPQMRVVEFGVSMDASLLR